MLRQAAIGLEKAVAKEPEYAEAISCLSQVYTHSYRFDIPLPSGPPDRLAAAMELAIRAVELAPQSSRSFHALALALWFSGNTQDSLKAYKTGLELNPNSTELIAELGLRKAMLGEWSEGISLLQEAFTKSPALNEAYRIGLSVCYFALERYEEALVEAQRSNVSQLVYMPICEGAALVGLNRHKEAYEAVQKILEISPNYGAIMTDDLLKRGLHPDVTNKYVEALRDAGLPMEDQKNLQMTFR
jgi:adenylate cyclase